jgi:fructose-1,6-bisphosphatase I
MTDASAAPREWTGDATVDGVFEAVCETIPAIRAGLGDRRSYLETENPSGERMLAADEHADERFEEALLAVDGVASYASEEREAVVHADEVGPGAPDAVEEGYHLAVDPLDGSSNLKSNNCMGTIVGVYDRPLPTRGRNLVAAGYVLYGPNTTLIVADGDAVAEYLIEGGDSKLLEDDVTIPEDPTVYGFGGRTPDWPPDVAEFVEEIEAERLKLRYGGALIADVAQVLTYGGIFSYPTLSDAPEGKLRLQFECNPIGFVVETAGGRASDGHGNVLDAEPERLHQRRPLYVGTESLIDRLEARLS